MLMKLVTSLSSRKSRHLEESELDDRGNHAVGEFVCAAQAVSKGQEILWYRSANRAIARFIARADSIEGTTQAGIEYRDRVHRGNIQSSWIAVVVSRRNISRYVQGI
jgi:hypothetical protein